MIVLLTGGLGYIGSHAALALASKGFGIVLLDNLSRGGRGRHSALCRLLGREVPFVVGDIRDTALVARAMKNHRVTAVMHFAALKSPVESFVDPLSYFDNNVVGTISLLKAMELVGVRDLVFSSSASVYGEPERLPIPEDHPLRPLNPYGESKRQTETVLEQVARFRRGLRVVTLRYFNPVGAHESGLLGEDLDTDSPNLMPQILRVAAGKTPFLNIYGTDYPTLDGTGVRDYIHVVDLAVGHVHALEWLLDTNASSAPFEAFNLGTGSGVSVLQLIECFERTTGKTIDRRSAGRRTGDSAASYAAVGKAERLLAWRPTHDLASMCWSAWHSATLNLNQREVAPNSANHRG